MTRSNQRRIIIYPVALVVIAALILLMLRARARDEKAYIGTLQNGGELLAKIGAHEEAAKRARKILQIDPDNLYAHLLLALTYQRTSRHEESIREYEVSLELADNPEQRQYIELLEDTIARVQEQAGGKALLLPHVAAFELLGMINWLYQWYRPDGPVKQGDLTQAYTDFFFRGLLGSRA